jgi:hypothetical protein
VAFARKLASACSSTEDSGYTGALAPPLLPPPLLLLLLLAGAEGEGLQGTQSTWEALSGAGGSIMDATRSDSTRRAGESSLRDAALMSPRWYAS